MAIFQVVWVNPFLSVSLHQIHYMPVVHPTNWHSTITGGNVAVAVLRSAALNEAYSIPWDLLSNAGINFVPFPF